MISVIHRYIVVFSMQDALSQLTEMGFSDTRAKKALLINKYADVVNLLHDIYPTY